MARKLGSESTHDGGQQKVGSKGMTLFKLSLKSSHRLGAYRGTKITFRR